MSSGTTCYGREGHRYGGGEDRNDRLTIGLWVGFMDAPAPRNRNTKNLGAAVIALLPGFVFPFVLPLVVGEGLSDTYFLAVSIALTLTNVIGNAIELNTVAVYGKALAANTQPASVEMRRYTRRVVTFAVIATATVAPVLFTIYFLGAHDKLTFTPVAAIAAVTPLLAAFTSVLSGTLIARGRSAFAVVMQAPRAGLPLLVAVAIPQVSLIHLALSFVTAEILRLAVLALAVNKVDKTGSRSTERLSTRGMTWQSLSAALAQGGPVTDRLFLSPTVGAVTAYELADKLFFSAVQFLNFGYLLRRVGMWARLPGLPRREATAIVRRDFTRLFIGALCLAGLGICATLAANSWGVLPVSWSRGVWWSAILFVSLPFTMISMAAGRLVIIAGRQRILFWMSTLTLVGNATLDAAFYFAFGVDGIPIATVILRILAAAIYVVVIVRIVPRISPVE
jgi:Na+-driven multidrug efflux pump